MAQGVSCPSGRPQHADSAVSIDFGPNFVDLSRVPDEENDKDTAKNKFELLG